MIQSMSECSYSDFLDVFFLFGLGVSCIHPAYFGLRPSVLFLKYTLLIEFFFFFFPSMGKLLQPLRKVAISSLLASTRKTHIRLSFVINNPIEP
jgi:hypothetical protein